MIYRIFATNTIAFLLTKQGIQPILNAKVFISHKVLNGLTGGAMIHCSFVL